MIVGSILKEKQSNTVTTTVADQSVGDAAKLLNSKRIGALLVVDDKSAIVGIISERDIARGLALHGGKVEAMTVRDLMTSDVLVCSPEDPLEKLMGVMTNNRIRHLPVLDKGKLAGMITIGDVVKARLEEAAMQVDQLRDYVMAGR
ncbi:MAG TPA: CBS domain-containing protein [Rhodospirillaceae bacterium]|nr:CBS domain-containing protein [Rhodospirillaceae bacterium]